MKKGLILLSRYLYSRHHCSTSMLPERHALSVAGQNVAHLKTDFAKLRVTVVYAQKGYIASAPLQPNSFP